MTEHGSSPQSAPWWVPYVFIAVLVLAAFVFTLQGKMGAMEFLTFATALGFRAPATTEAVPGQK